MDQYAAAEGALREAINAVQAIDCNSRDYYPIGADAASVAMGEKRARLQALERIRAEMEAHALHIDDQITARAARRQPATA
jgi:hypothetical protein